MKSILSLIISGALVVSGFSQTRNVLVGTNNAVVQPTNFWSADASNARAGLGLGTAATNPASAFQPASSALTNLVSGDGGSLTNIKATNLVGLIPTSNIPQILLTNIGTITIAQGGTSATNAANARQNLGSTTVGDAVFIATNAESARTALGGTTVGSSLFTAIDASAARAALSLGTASTNPASAFQPSSTVLSNLASSNGVNLTNLQFSNIAGTIAISNGGTGAINAGGARTNLGLGATNSVTFNSVNTELLNYGTNYIISLVNQELYDASGQGVLSWNSNGVEFGSSNIAATTRTNLGLGATNNVAFQNLFLDGGQFSISNSAIYWLGAVRYEPETQTFVGTIQIDDGSLSIVGSNAAANIATTRTNLGLGWSALTNTNAGTGLVSVNTNGDVVSPTNFWQRAPIQTTVQDFTGITVSQTNNATNARNVYVYSLATNVSGISNTIILPTNTSTFNGDEVCVIHKGTTNTTTVVRQAGSTNNLITLNRFDESVKFIRELGQWDFYHNISYVEPIQFSGTNASNNAAASRTNLGMPLTALTNTNVTNFRTEIGLGATNNVVFSNISLSGTLTSTGVVTMETNLNVGGAISVTNAATTRTNLGLGATNNVTFADVTASGTLTATSTVTARTNLVVEGFVNYTEARTNNTPTNIPNFAAHVAWIEVKIGTNSFFLPAYQ